MEAIQLRDQLIKQCQTKDATVQLDHPLALLQLQGNTIEALQQQAKDFSLKSKKKLAKMYTV